MKRYLPLLAALVLERGLFALWGGWEMFKPLLVLLAVCYLGLTEKPATAVLTAAAAGLLLDFSGWGPLGAWLFCLGSTALVVALLRESLYPKSPLVRFVTVAAAGFYAWLILWALAGLTGAQAPPGGWTMLSRIGVTALAAPPLYELFDRLMDTSYEGQV